MGISRFVHLPTISFESQTPTTICQLAFLFVDRRAILSSIFMHTSPISTSSFEVIPLIAGQKAIDRTHFCALSVIDSID
jgi:hypothetical protein